MPKTKTNKNPIITLVLVVATSVFIFAAAVRPAQAFPGLPNFSFTMGDIPRQLDKIWENIKKKTGSRAFQQAIRSVSYKLAQDTALWISSGGKGKKPLIFENFGKFMTESADVVAGKYLVNLSQGWPVDLCSPTNIRSKLAITVGLPKVLKDLEFRSGKINKDVGAQGCKLTTMGQNFAQEAKKSNFLVKFSQDFTGLKSDLGVAMQLQEDIKKQKEQYNQEELVKRYQSGDLKSVDDYLTKFPNTTKEQVKEAQAEAQRRASEKPPRTEDIFLDTMAVFANTLAKQYLNKFRSGFYPFRKTARPPDSPLAGVSGAEVSDKALLASFSEFSPERALQLGQSGEIDLFADMLSCPPGQYQSPYNCLLSDGLSQAVQQKLTVKQALERKALNPDMIFPEKHDPDKPNLSLLNLRKLRFLRVLPLGWEIAAEKLENASRRDITLSTVVNCFDSSNADSKCDLDGGGNDLAGLMDPDWVLALPQQYCRAQGWIGVTMHEQSPNRAQACVDLQSCVKEDESGKCEGYGYCTRERQLWQISGQTCDAQYATCQNFTRPNGTALSVLGSSVNNAGCREDSAGCSWYSQTPSPGGAGVGAWYTNSRVYLNSQAQSCRAEDAGSREIIPLEPGANLVRNSGFDEEFASVLPTAGGWDAADRAAVVNEARPGTGQISQRIYIKTRTYYTLSVFAKKIGPAGPDTATISVTAPQPTIGGPVALRNVSFSEPEPAAPGSEAQALSFAIPNLIESLGRFAATFYSGNVTTVVIALSGDVVFDNIQLEEIELTRAKKALETVAANLNGGAAVLNSSPPGQVNVASPATSYQGYEDNRRLVFADAASCAADEATARAYTSTLSQETVIARLSPDGLCPKDCGGLTSFLAMPTPMDILSAESDYKTPQVRSFVPTYGKACSASEVGCEEFTNITQKGAEQKQYFSTIRACVLDTNPNAASFYTWEGKEQAGFQLKVWKLLKDRNGANGNGPCATFTQGAGQDPKTASCQDGADGSAECDIYDENCRVFLDEGGHEYKRDVTKIVSVSNECAAFRRTKLAPGATEQEVWHFIPSEARSCGAAAVACREYKGSRANVVTNLLFTNFESGLDNWTGGVLSKESITAKSVIAGSQSFSFNGTASKDIGPALSGQSGNMLLLKFLAKKASDASTTINGALYQSDGTTLIANFSREPVSLVSDWQSFTLGPVEFKKEVLSAVLKIESVGAVFIDNITLLASPDRLYLITDSWKDKQPAVCSATDANGTPLLSQCNAYADKKSNTFYVSGFEALFPEQAQYCEAVIDTQNSESPFSQQFNTANDGGGDPNKALDNITVLADQFMYRYIEAKNLRNKDAAGCTALGAPRLDSGNTPAGWDAAYRKLEPDNFASTLCLAEAVGCQAFRAEDGGTKVFRDPGKKLCAWDTEDSVFVKLDDNGQPKAPKENCYQDNSSPPQATPGWAVQCPSDQGGCTAYAPTNPNLTEGASSALFVKRDTVEAGSCASGEDIGLGCVNFKEGFSDAVATPPILSDKLSTARERALKVDARRECAEWLAPTTTSQVNDPNSRSVRTVVYDLGRCQKLDASGSCEQWTSHGDTTSPGYPSAYGDPIGTLQTQGYVSRIPLDAGRAPTKNIFSGAWDYAGYSILNQYPIELLAENTAVNPPVLSYNNTNATSTLACRSYPEEDSPFDSRNLTVDQATGKFFYNANTRHLENVNKFEPGEYDQCQYKKAASAEGGNKYFQINTTRPLPEDAQSITDLRGWSGYCLDYDKDTRDPATGEPLCLSWWPVDVVQAGANIFDNHPEAGYTSSGPLYYCLEAKGNKIQNDTLQFLEAKDNNYLITAAGKSADGKKVDNEWPSRQTAFAENFVTVPAVPSVNITENKSVWNANTEEWNTITTTKQVPDPSKIYKPLAPYDNSGGPESGSGVVKWTASPTSPLANLHEYDIEAIVLTARNAESTKQWPANNEQLILNREGFAASSLEDVTTKDRWTALWCGGRDVAKCKFGGEYTWDKFKSAIEATSKDSGACSTHEEDSIDHDGATNILAIRSRFADEKGNGGNFGAGEDGEFEPYQFLGLEGGLCDNTRAAGWVDFQITFQLREWCSAVAQVHTGTENKAWTGRIVGKSEVDYQPIYYKENGGYFGTALNYTNKQDNPPFGAAVPPVSFIYTPEQWDSRKDFIEEEVVENSQLVTVQKALEPGKQPLYVEQIKGKGQIRAGSPYYCIGTVAGGASTCEAPSLSKDKVLQPRTTGLDQAFLHLKQIFAKVVKVWRWAFNESAYDEYEKAKLPADWDDDLSELIGECPVIEAAVRSGKAWGANGDKNAVYSANCGADVRYAGRYSVNGAQVKHANGTVVVDPFVAVGIGEEVTLTFYGYNQNGEQLPLNSIEIDWDDGIKTKTTGSFKNHRANCSPTGNYGQTSRACDSEPFQFKHVYQKKDGYTPTVKITDNWGRWTQASYAGTVIRVDTGLVSRTPPSTTEPLKIESATGNITINRPDPFNATITVTEGGFLDATIITNRASGVTWRRRVQPISGESWITINPATGQLSGNTTGKVGLYDIYVVASEVITNADGSKTKASAQARIPLAVTPREDLTALGWWATYRNSSGKITNPGTAEAFPVIAARAEPGPDPPPADQNRYPLNFAENTKRLNRWLPTDSDGNIIVGRADGDNRKYFTVVWQGLLVIKPNEPAGQYKFRLGSDDGSDLFIDNQMVINNGGDHDYQTKSAEIFLTPGLHDIRVRYYNNQDEAEIKLEWRPPGQPTSVVLPIGTAADPRIKHIPPFDYTLSIAPAAGNQEMYQGVAGSNDFNLTAAKSAGQAEPVKFSFSGVPGGFTASFAGADTCTPTSGTCSVVLRVEKGDGVRDAGDHSLIVNASPGNKITRLSFSVGAPDFSARPDSGEAPLRVNFNQPDTSSSWNFGDGQTGVGANPTHTYTRAGSYTVTLTVNGKSRVKENLITVSAPLPPFQFTFWPGSPGSTVTIVHNAPVSLTYNTNRTGGVTFSNAWQRNSPDWLAFARSESGGSVTLTSTNSDSAGGTYQFLVDATHGGTTIEKIITIIDQGTNFGWTTSASGNITVPVDGAGSIAVTATRQEGSRGLVRGVIFGVDGLPTPSGNPNQPPETATFNPVSCTPEDSCTTTLTIDTHSYTPAGSYTVTLPITSIIPGGPNGGTVGRFTLTVLAPPTLKSPVDDSIGSSITPVLSWQASGAPPHSYQLQVYSNMNLVPNSLAFYKENITLLRETVTGLSYRTNYWWRVREALNDGGQGPWSKVWHFTTRIHP